MKRPIHASVISILLATAVGCSTPKDLDEDKPGDSTDLPDIDSGSPADEEGDVYPGDDPDDTDDDIDWGDGTGDEMCLGTMLMSLQ